MAEKNRDSSIEEGGTNFFIPMVDLMVSILFLFIIVVMILVLQIREDAVASLNTLIKQEAIISETIVVNRTAAEQLAEDIVQEVLSQEGTRMIFDENTGILRSTARPPQLSTQTTDDETQ